MEQLMKTSAFHTTLKRSREKENELGLLPLLQDNRLYLALLPDLAYVLPT